MTDVEARDAALPDAEIEMEVPAAGEYLSVLRTAAAGLGAQMDFTLDDIEDLRIAVDEASALLLAQANPDSRLCCRFVLNEDTVTFRASVRVQHPQLPSREGFAWTVLTSLVDSVDVRLSEADLLTIELSRRRPGTRDRGGTGLA